MRKILVGSLFAGLMASSAMADRLGGVGGLLYASNTVFNASISASLYAATTVPGAGSLIASSTSVYDGATIRKFRLFQGERVQVLAYGSYNCPVTGTTMQVSIMLGGSSMIASSIFTLSGTGTLQVWGGGQVETRETSTLGAQSTWWLKVQSKATAAAFVAGTKPVLNTALDGNTLDISPPVAVSSVPDFQRLSLAVGWSGTQTGGGNTIVWNCLDEFAY